MIERPNDELDLASGSQSPRRVQVSGTNLLLLLFAVAAAATGQLLLKHGMQLAVKQSEHDGSLIACAATSPWVLGGLGIFGISAIAWLSTLARVPLSVAYPFNALGYLGILAASVLVLHEKASIWTWAGTTLVASGLVIVVLTSP